MSPMTFPQQVITIALCVLGTVATRFLPFLVFAGQRKTPDIVQYLGKALPSAIFAMLMVYVLTVVPFSATMVNVAVAVSPGAGALMTYAPAVSVAPVTLLSVAFSAGVTPMVY